jgi:hypothetical protein
MSKIIDCWTRPASVSLPSVHVRSVRITSDADVERIDYLVSAFGGDEHGDDGPDDDAVLDAVCRLVCGPGENLRWVSLSEWDVDAGSDDGVVVRRAEVC